MQTELQFAPPADEMSGDCAWLLTQLSDGRPHSLNELLRASFAERGCGLTVHSRVSDLRVKYGRNIEHSNAPGRGRGDRSVYRLVRAA